MSIVATSGKRYRSPFGAMAAGNSFSLSFWAKTSSQGGASDATLTNVGNASSDDAQFFIDSGTLHIYSDNNGDQGGAATFTGQDFYAMTWTVVAGLATPILYLNGSVVTTNGNAFPWGTAPWAASPALWALCTGNGEEASAGWEMADLILNVGVVATAGQVVAQMAQAAPLIATGLYGYWPFGASLTDSSGNGHDFVMDAGTAQFGSYTPFPATGSSRASVICAA